MICYNFNFNNWLYENGFWLSQLFDFNKTLESQWQKCQACKSFDAENKFLTQFGCTVKITLDIYQIHILLDK